MASLGIPCLPLPPYAGVHMELDLGLGGSLHPRTQYQGTGHHNLLMTQPRDKAQFPSICMQFLGPTNGSGECCGRGGHSVMASFCNHPVPSIKHMPKGTLKSSHKCTLNKLPTCPCHPITLQQRASPFRIQTVEPMMTSLPIVTRERSDRAT